MRKLLVLVGVTLFIFSFSVYGQELKTKNVILVTLDGFRWQELFQGADSSILFNKRFVKDKKDIGSFWSPSPAKRREKLLPFIWNTIGTKGQLYGNRNFGNDDDCSNPYWFSYPGYAEMLVGYVDKKISSNKNIENPHPTVLEFIDRQSGFRNKVAVFSTWNTVSYITRENTGGIPVNVGKDGATSDIASKSSLLKDLQESMPDFHFDQYDALTFYSAMEYLNRLRPRVLFISFNETDRHGHGGRYGEYLKSAHRADAMLRALWNWIQSQEDYRDQTTLIVTTDHGRGNGRHGGWKRHGRLTPGSGHIWTAVIGPDTPAEGEIKTTDQFYQKQIAGTIASLLGLHYTNDKEVGEPIDQVINNRDTSTYMVSKD